MEVGIDRLYDIVSFVVIENYNHHSSGLLPHNVNQEIEEIFSEELSYSKTAEYFIVYNNEKKMIGCIRVFKWDKRTLIPMQKIFHVSPLENVQCSDETTFWHIGRFAIDSNSEISTLTFFKQLMTLAVSPILKDQDSYMIAETDSRLLKVMNAFGIETEQIGKPMNYLASETIPIYSSKNGLSVFFNRFYPLLGLN